MRKSVIIAACICASHATAQEFDPELLRFEVGLSSLGVAIAPVYQLSPELHIRAPIHLGSATQTFEDDDVTLDGSLDLQAFSVMADYYPFENGLRVSGGVSMGGIKLTGETTEFLIGGEEYTGDFAFELAQESATAPVISIGYMSMLNDQFGLYSELGARITSLDLSVTGQDVLPDADREQFNTDLAEANDDLDQLPVIPFLSVGVAFKF